MAFYLLPPLEPSTDEGSIHFVMSGAGLLITGGGGADAEEPGGSGAGGGIVSLISLASLPKMSPLVLVSGGFLAAAALLLSGIFFSSGSGVLAPAMLLFALRLSVVFLVSDGLSQ